MSTFSSNLNSTGNGVLIGTRITARMLSAHGKGKDLRRCLSFFSFVPQGVAINDMLSI